MRRRRDMGGIKRQGQTATARATASPVRAGAIAWDDAPTELERKCVFASVYGDTDTGRTTWALSAPEPIALIHAAEKIEGIVQPFAREKEIRVFDFSVDLSKTTNVDEAAALADKAWRQLRAAWYDAFTWARTIILDTDTDAWELIRFAFFGDLKPSGGRIETNWGPVNAEWLSMFKHFKHQNRANVIVISQTKDEYTKAVKGKMGERTGRTVRATQKNMGFLSEVVVRMRRGTGGVFTATIEKEWWNGAMFGVEVDGALAEAYGRDRVDFPTVMALITDSDVAAWS